MGFTCTEYETAMCCWTAAMSEKKNVTVDHYNGLYLIKEQSVERIFSDHTSINRFVVSEAVLKCLQLIETCYGKNSVLYGYNTDGIYMYITNPVRRFKNKKDVKFSTKRIGNAYVTDSKPSYFEKHYRKNLDMNDYKVKTGKGCIHTGQAGSGKTTMLCEMVKKPKNPLVLSFTNKAIENIKSRLIEKDFKNDMNNICFTFDSYFCDWKGRDINSLEGKTIVIEEFSMVPNKWMTMIYKAYTMFGNKIHMFGDPNQCEPVRGGSQINYDYLRSKTINEMCGKVEKLGYIEKTCRYDKQTHELLYKFLKHGKISTYFQPIDKNLNKNICYLNSTRIKINTQCCDQFSKGKKYETVEFKYNNKKEKYKVSVGVPIIATQNIKNQNIFNTMEFRVKDISDKQFLVNNVWYDINKFSKNFIPSFCVTVYKYQGADINEPYNIFDVNRIDKKQLYTALSRTTKHDYIHVNNKEFNRKYFNRKQPVIELVNSKFNSLYNKGKIYKVTFSNKMVYTGSTCEELETWFKWHLSDKNSQVFKHKDKNSEIELIVYAPSKDKKSLENVENKHITEFADKYGELLLNKRCNPLKKSKKVEYQVMMENKQQLEERIAKLEDKLTIKDDAKNKLFYFDAIIDGKRQHMASKYKRCTKDEALKSITRKQQEKIKELTIYFE